MFDRWNQRANVTVSVATDPAEITAIDLEVKQKVSKLRHIKMQ